MLAFTVASFVVHVVLHVLMVFRFIQGLKALAQVRMCVCELEPTPAHVPYELKQWAAQPSTHGHTPPSSCMYATPTHT